MEEPAPAPPAFWAILLNPSLKPLAMDDASADTRDALSSFFGIGKLGFPKPCMRPVEYAPLSTFGAYANCEGSVGGTNEPPPPP